MPPKKTSPPPGSAQSRGDLIRAVVARIEKAGCDGEDLVGEVKDCKDIEADQLNENGLYFQVEYLIEQGYDPDRIVEAAKLNHGEE